MSGILWASLGVAIGVGVPFLWQVWQRRGAGSEAAGATAAAPRVASLARLAPQAATRPNTRLNRKQTRKFHGVSLKPGHQPCSAIQALAGRRFLPDEAPAMPLAACDQQQCQCGYAHHGDRRDPGDRRFGWGTFGGFTPSVAGGNRRSKNRERRRNRP